MKSDLKKSEKIGGRTPTSKINAQKSREMRNEVRSQKKCKKGGKNTNLENKRPEKSKSEDLWSDSCGARRLKPLHLPSDLLYVQRRMESGSSLFGRACCEGKELPGDSFVGHDVPFGWRDKTLLREI